MKKIDKLEVRVRTNWVGDDPKYSMIDRLFDCDIQLTHLRDDDLGWVMLRMQEKINELIEEHNLLVELQKK